MAWYIDIAIRFLPLRKLLILLAGNMLLGTLNFSLGFILFLYFYIVKLLLIKVYNLKREYNIKNNIIFVVNYLNINLTVFIIYQLILLLTIKISVYNIFSNMLVVFLFFFFLLFIWLYMNFIKKYNHSRSECEITFFVIMLLNLSVICLFFVNDFILFFLNLEILSIIFYLFFLTYTRNKDISLIRYKNLLSSYVWGTFFSTLLYFFSVLCLVRCCGSLLFVQVSFMYLHLPVYIWQIVLLSFLLKIGGPGFYFFKLEIYQWLSTLGVYNFSIFTIFLNCFFLVFFFSYNWYIYNTYNFYFVCYVLMFTIFLNIRGFYSMSFYQFWGLSSVNSWIFLILLLIL